jgi:hypothetical protein
LDLETDRDCATNARGPIRSRTSVAFISGIGESATRLFSWQIFPGAAVLEQDAPTVGAGNLEIRSS